MQLRRRIAGLFYKLGGGGRLRGVLLVIHLTWWDFDDCSWMPAEVLVSVGRLYEYSALTFTFCEYLVTDIIQPDSFTCKIIRERIISSNNIIYEK